MTAKKDGHLGFGGLNPWQPLGKSVYAGETLLVYVGHNTRRTGLAADLQLVFTQHHSGENFFLNKKQKIPHDHMPSKKTNHDHTIKIE